MSHHRPYSKIKESSNAILESNNQYTRIEFINRERIELNNGLKLTGTEKQKFLKIITHLKTKMWRESVDYIVNGDFNERYEEIRKKVNYKNNSELLKHRIATGQLNPGKCCLGKDPWNKGKHYKRKVPFSDIERQHHRECKLGTKNPMYGVSHSQEYKKIVSDRMKEKILKGEFTPNTNNRHTHFDVTYRGKVFRSSWEAVFYCKYHETYQYEKLRIPYTFDNENHIYIVDFINEQDKIAVEIKPSSILERNSKEQAKLNALKTWCINNEYKLWVVDENDIRNIVYELNGLEEFDYSTQQKLIKQFGVKNETSGC